MKLTKRILTAALAATVAVCGAEAKKMSDLKVYINPGHGGYTSNDRPIRIYPFAQNDTLGYWESKSNLVKGLHMYHILDSLGTRAMLSRTKNTEADDRSLSGISTEANQFGADIFFSIHSNAGENVNYPLMLYRENAIGTPRYEGNVTLSKILWNNLHSSKLSMWTRDKEYVEGDLTFYQNMWSGGLGVLRGLYVVGLLSEGGMHEHQPEAHRLMNDDFCWLEAWHFVRAVMEYENTEDRFVTGNVAGVVYDNHNLREKYQPVNYSRYRRDCLAVLNGATVELLDEAGNVVQRRTTDNMYNGVFVFRNVKPGNYKVRTARSDYYTETVPVTVTANEVSYQDMAMTLRREAPLTVTKYTPNVPEGELVSCASTLDFEFNTDIDTESWEKAFSITPAVQGYWEYSDSYTKARFVPSLSLDLNTKYTVRVEATAKTPDTYYSHPQMEQALEYSFTTKGRNRLEVIGQFPADNGTIHYAAPTLEVRFDKALGAGKASDWVTVTDASGAKVTINDRSSKTNQLTNGFGNMLIALTGNLKVGQTYKVSVSDALRDKENLPMGGAMSYSFKAIDAAAEGTGMETKLDFEATGMPFAYDPENTVGITSTLPTAIRSTSMKLFGAASGRFGYNFADMRGGNIVWNYTGEPVKFNTGDRLGMYIYGDFNNHELWVGVASGTNEKYTKVCDLDFLGWQYREVSLDNLEADFCPFLLHSIKLVQKESPITQKGYFAVDNLCFKASAGVEDIVADGTDAVVEGGERCLTVTGAASDARVTVYTPNGAVVATATGNCRLSQLPGLYIVKVGKSVHKVTVK